MPAELLRLRDDRRGHHHRLHLLLQRVAMAVRQEQMIGTLEALLVTPTSPTTVQVGSVAFDLVFVPIRMALLLPPSP